MRKLLLQLSGLAALSSLGACFLFVAGLGAAPCDDATFVERCDGAIRTFCEGDFVSHETCAQTCTLNAAVALCIICGNGQIEPGEECDGGADCRADCTIPFCGDGITDPDELCDGDPGCAAGCQALCGNLTVEPGEACDDGNLADSDGCRADCAGFEVCGDGLVDLGEECDDGDNDSIDGCSGACLNEFCGDGILNFEPAFDQVEECDDGNVIDGDGCDINCTPTGCDNNNASPGELCLAGAFVSLAVPNGIPAALAVGDIDNANGPDLVLATGAAGKVVILFNDGDGVFSFANSQEFDAGAPANSDPRDLALGDLDGDQDLDIVVANLGTDEVFILTLSDNGQTATATQLASGVDPIAIKLRDVNSDQRLDIVALNRANAANSASIFLQGDDLSFSRTDIPIGDFSFSLDLGDLDGDQDLDIVTADQNSQQLSVLVNNGAGQFPANLTINVGRAVNGVALLDFDLDGKPDVLDSFNANAGGSLELRRNLHPGGAFAVGSLAAPALQDALFLSPNRALLEVADLNNQAPPELLFVASNASFARSLSFDGVNGLHSLSATDDAIVDFSAADLNEDGALDLAAAITGNNSINLLLANP